MPKTQKKKSNQAKSHNYASWDAFTQAQYLYDLHKALGQPVTIQNAYEIAAAAVTTDAD